MGVTREEAAVMTPDEAATRDEAASLVMPSGPGFVSEMCAWCVWCVSLCWLHGALRVNRDLVCVKRDPVCVSKKT